MEIEKKNMLQNHSVEDHGSYLTLTLGDDEVVVTHKHKDTVTELCEYLDCLNLLIALTNGQNLCIEQQGEKIAKLMAENDELYKKLDELITEKTELGHKMEAYKDANARLGEQIKHLKATVKNLEEYNDFNEECRKMHLNAVKKDLDEAVAEKRVMAVEIDRLQSRVNNQESLIKRIRAVAEHNAESSGKFARELAELKQQLRDVGDWIETIVNPEEDNEE